MAIKGKKITFKRINFYQCELTTQNMKNLRSQFEIPAKYCLIIVIVKMIFLVNTHMHARTSLSVELHSLILDRLAAADPLQTGEEVLRLLTARSGRSFVDVRLVKHAVLLYTEKHRPLHTSASLTAPVMPSAIRTFLLLAVAAGVGVVAVQRACGHVRPAAVVLSVQRVDGDVDQMEHHVFTHVHVSVWILKHRTTQVKKIPEFMIDCSYLTV